MTSRNNDTTSKEKHYISFENGLLNVTDFINSLGGNLDNFDDALSSVKLEQHQDGITPISELPYEFDSTAEANLALRFLKSILPDEEDLRLTFQWWGNALAPINEASPMFIGIGDGANGKTAWATLMECTVGEKNVSRIPIQKLSGIHGGIHPLSMRLVNIDQSGSKASGNAKELMKMITSASPVIVERKNQPSQVCKITTRLTCLGNELPIEKGDTPLRRTVGIHFLYHIDLDRSYHDYSDNKFWNNSGELPGVFNLALKGLADILLNDKFAMSTTAKQMLEEPYRNPVKEWLLENYEECEERGEPVIVIKDMYSAYVEYMECGNNRSLGRNEFYKELDRAFPHARKGRTLPGIRQKEYESSPPRDLQTESES